MKKIFSKWLVGVLLVVCLFGFGGCKKETGPIPDGYYIYQTSGEFVYCEKSHRKFLVLEKVHSDFYIKIEGDKMEEMASGLVHYKAKVVEKEGKIYFEGHKWKNIFGDTIGVEFNWEVTYDEERKTITITQVI